MSGRPPVTFVLVHGLFHGAWCWRRVVDPLRAGGHRVYPLTLTGLGERAHLLSDRVSLDTFVADVIGVLEAEELTDVILVGHSFGAVPVLGVADAVPEQLRRLILIDGALPTPGRHLLRGPAPGCRGRPTAAGDGVQRRRVPPPVSATAFGITDPDDIAWVDRQLTRTRCGPTPIRSNPSPARQRATVQLPRLHRSALRAGGGRHEQARARTDWSWHELPTGHDPMITAPDLLLDRLLNLTGG